MTAGEAQILDGNGWIPLCCRAAPPFHALLRSDYLPREPYAARVRDSDLGRRLSAGTDPPLPVADLDCCAAVDRFDFVLPIRRTQSGMVIRRVRGATAMDRQRSDAAHRA